MKPEKFQILGREYTIVYKKMKHDLGRLDPDNSIVYMSTLCPEPVFQESLDHEAMHAILNILGYDELYPNEVFVSSISAAFRQYLETLK